MRREVPILITVVSGLLILGDAFFKNPTLKTAAVELNNWIIIVSALMVGIASVNLVMIHSNNISRKRPGWFNSLALLVSLVGYTVISVANKVNGSNEFFAYWYKNIYNNLQAPLGSAMFAIIAFYVASASYRAFRARSLEASVLLIAALLVMLGKAPVGALIWDQFPEISKWLLNIANTAGQRGIMIGAAIGAFVTSLRVLLGIERGHLGGVE